MQHFLSDVTTFYVIVYKSRRKYLIVFIKIMNAEQHRLIFMALTNNILIIGIVNDLLSWPGFQPLVRLSFIVYLVHTQVYMVYTYSLQGPQDATHATIVRIYYFKKHKRKPVLFAFVIKDVIYRVLQNGWYDRNFKSKMIYDNFRFRHVMKQLLYGWPLNRN